MLEQLMARVPANYRYLIRQQPEGGVFVHLIHKDSEMRRKRTPAEPNGLSRPSFNHTGPDVINAFEIALGKGALEEWPDHHVSDPRRGKTDG